MYLPVVYTICIQSSYYRDALFSISKLFHSLSIKSPGCFFKGHRFNSQAWIGSSQLPITPVQGENPTLSVGVCGKQAHTVHRHMQAKHSYTQK